MQHDTKSRVQTNVGREKPMSDRFKLVLVVAVGLGIALGISVFINITSPYPPNTIVGTVDHRGDYENTDAAGQPIIQYSISIRPINEDRIAGNAIGETMGYNVPKEDYDAVNANDIVVARILSVGVADIVQVIPQEQWIREECVGQPNLSDPLSEDYCAKG